MDKVRLVGPMEPATKRGLCGSLAVQRSADAEAVTHLSTALDLLQTLPESRERAEQELRVQVALGAALLAINDWTAPELESAYTRALALSRQVGDTAHLFTALRGLWILSAVKGELRTTRELGEQLVQLAEEAQSPSLQMEAHYALGYALLYLGEVHEASAHLEQAIGLYDPHQHASLRFVYGMDEGVSIRVTTAYAWWVLGYPAQAQQAMQDALGLAQELSHPLSVAMALAYVAGHHLHCRDYARAQEFAKSAVTLAEEHEFAWWTAVGWSFHGRALVGQGQLSEGIAQIQQGLAAFRTLGTVVVWKSGQAAEGLRVVADAFEAVNTTAERWYDAELYRLRGELMLQLSPAQQDDAASCFQQALDVARQQEAKSWELRAATSLARLWQQQDKTAEARDLLTPVYDWFTEGFDTKDLQDAKTLLDALGEHV